MFGYRFHFRPVLTAAVALALAVLVSLGNWQLHRLEWKTDLIAQISARTDALPIAYADAVRRAEQGEAMEYTPVVMSGARVDGTQALVFGTYDGAPGAYVFSALRANDMTVYVNHGFAPQLVLKENGLAPPTAQETITGLLRYPENLSPPASWFRTREQSVDGFWYIRDPAAFAAAAKLDVAPYYIDRFHEAARDWPKGGTTRLTFSNRHLEYALTWFGLAVTLLGVWIAFSLQKR